MNVIIYDDIGTQINLGAAQSEAEAVKLALGNGYTATRAVGELMEKHTEIECGAERVWVVYA